MINLKNKMKSFKIIINYFISFLFFLGLLPAFFVGVGYGLDRLFRIPQINACPYCLIFSYVLIVFGLFWMIWSMLAIIFIGRGNPQEVFGKEFLPSAKKLIIVGPYRYTRNPMIFGWLLIMFGVGLYFGSISLLLIVFPAFIVSVIFYIHKFEEPKLLEKFGDDYVEYRRKIPILLPKF